MRIATIHPTRRDPSHDEPEPTHDDALLGSAWDLEIEREWLLGDSGHPLRVE